MSSLRKRRPTSVSVVCYLLLIIGGLGIIRATLTFLRPAVVPAEPPVPPILIAGDVLDSLLIISCALFMLRGANWARIAFYVGSALLAVGLLATQPSGDAFLKILKLIVLGAFLATSRANRFFSGGEPIFGGARVDGPVTARPPADAPRPGPRLRRRRYDY